MDDRRVRLMICDLVNISGLNGGFREMIPYSDLVGHDNEIVIFQTLKSRVKEIGTEFDKLVRAEVARECADFLEQYTK